MREKISPSLVYKKRLFRTTCAVSGDAIREHILGQSVGLSFQKQPTNMKEPQQQLQEEEKSNVVSVELSNIDTPLEEFARRDGVTGHGFDEKTLKIMRSLNTLRVRYVPSGVVSGAAAVAADAVGSVAASNTSNSRLNMLVTEQGVMHGKSARNIADELGYDRSEVNRVLYSVLKAINYATCFSFQQNPTESVVRSSVKGKRSKKSSSPPLSLQRKLWCRIVSEPVTLASVSPTPPSPIHDAKSTAAVTSSNGIQQQQQQQSQTVEDTNQARDVANGSSGSGVSSSNSNNSLYRPRVDFAQLEKQNEMDEEEQKLHQQEQEQQAEKLQQMLLQRKESHARWNNVQDPQTAPQAPQAPMPQDLETIPDFSSSSYPQEQQQQQQHHQHHQHHQHRFVHPSPPHMMSPFAACPPPCLGLNFPYGEFIHHRKIRIYIDCNYYRTVNSPTHRSILREITSAFPPGMVEIYGFRLPVMKFCDEFCDSVPGIRLFQAPFCFSESSGNHYHHHGQQQHHHHYYQHQQPLYSSSSSSSTNSGISSNPVVGGDDNTEPLTNSSMSIVTAHMIMELMNHTNLERQTNPYFHYPLSYIHALRFAVLSATAKLAATAPLASTEEQQQEEQRLLLQSIYQETPSLYFTEHTEREIYHQRFACNDIYLLLGNNNDVGANRTLGAVAALLQHQQFNVSLVRGFESLKFTLQSQYNIFLD